MEISIIIATYNRAERLRFLLDALNDLHLSDGVQCEVLVIDNNSADSTKEVTNSYLSSENLKFRYLFERRQGKSYALNTGIRKAEGDILVFTDDDCVPDPYWVEHIIKEFEHDPSLSVVGGRVELYDKEDVQHAVSPSTSRLHLSHAREVCRRPVVIGCNMAFRKASYDVVREFDPLLGPATTCKAAEDLEILYRVFKKRLKIVYSPEILIYHNHGRKTQAEDVRLMREWGIGRGALYCKHILQSDVSMLKVASEEVYDLCKTLLKGLVVRKAFPYHRITLPSLFLGAFLYFRTSYFRREQSRGACQ